MFGLRKERSLHEPSSKVRGNVAVGRNKQGVGPLPGALGSVMDNLGKRVV